MNEVVESKKVTLTKFGAEVLGAHALTLPADDPARAQIMLLLGRYEAAPAIETKLESVAA